MAGITAILTAFRRPHTLTEQIEALRAQSIPPDRIWIWANAPTPAFRSALEVAQVERVVTCSENAFFHGRFALGLLAPSEFVAVFDDDTIPGQNWFRNCIETMEVTPGLLGTAGVQLHSTGYGDRTMLGWQVPAEEAVEVDLVGQAWFLRRDWIAHLFATAPTTGTNGEDIELAARAWRAAGIRSFCPPHPRDDRTRWGSLKGLELGLDEAAASLKRSHQPDRDRIVREEMAAGWKPLFQRVPTLIDRAQILWLGTNAESLRRLGQSAHVTAIDFGDTFLDSSLRETAVVESAMGELVTLADGDDLYDQIVLDDRLSRVRRPLEFLKRIRRRLKPTGVISATFDNQRHHRAVSSILYGRWGYGHDSPSKPTIRYFTRIEIVKLFYRAGFDVVQLQPTVTPELASWRTTDSTDHANIGQLRIGKLRPGEAEEFLVEHYEVKAHVAPVIDYGLTSIVVVTRDQWFFTKQCLDSIRFRSDEPFELIVVDNGSSDGTPDRLAAMTDVRLIRNESNRGFPAAANQGIAVSQGRQVLLLNNDTIVTTGWLRRLLEALYSDSSIGMVGPVSNCVSGEQQVPVEYEQLEELDGFAWRWSHGHRRQYAPTDRLVGFCLLARREVFDRVGLLDEQFGIGNFEDDDLCRRASEAGYRLLIAQDSFVHHFGSQTFRNSDIDHGELLAVNARRFQDKWSAASSPALRRNARSGSSTQAQASSPRISLCMIVRDNESTLPACLESIRPWVDEMVVVDTGSKDATPQIARWFGARVFDFPWQDSFSVARNESLRHARGEWVFWMDSDDTIPPECGRRLRELADGLHDPSVLGYVMQVHCPGPTGAPDDLTTVDHLKLFRNRADLRFEFHVHEQVLPAIRAVGGDVGFTDIYVVHSGSDHSPESRRRKCERDLRLLALDLAERPNHPFVLFNLGMTYADMEEFSKAVDALRQCIAASGADESHLRKAYALLVGSLTQQQNYDEAWSVCQQGRGLFPHDKELLFREAMVAHLRGDLDQARTSYEQVLLPSSETYFKSIDPGIAGCKARHNLAVVLAEMGDAAGAERQWRTILTDSPGYGDAWLQLADLLSKENRLAALADLVEEMAVYPHLGAARALVQARYHQKTGDPDVARGVLDEALAREPTETSLLNAVAQLLFEVHQEEHALPYLKRLAMLDPSSASVHHNLGAAWLARGDVAAAAESLQRSLALRPSSSETQRMLSLCDEAAGRRAL